MSPSAVPARVRIAAWIALALAGLGPPPAGAAAPAAEGPALIGQVGGIVGALAVEGARAYVATGSRVTVLDVTDPSAPVWLGQSAPLPNVLRHLVSAGRHVFATADDTTLYILDFGDAARPRLLGRGDLDGPGRGLAVVGNTAYVAVDRGQLGQGGLQTLDVTDPARPRRLGRADMLVLPRDVAVSGTYAFVADGVGLSVISVADPRAPRLVDKLDTPGGSERILLSGRTAYLAAAADGLQIVDVQDPRRPRHLGGVELPDRTGAVAVIGHVAYAAVGVAGLAVVDVTNPGAPRLLGTAPTADVALDIAVVGGHALVAGGAAGLESVDVANPALPAPLPQPALATLEAQHVLTDGAMAHVRTYFDRLWAFDLSTPASPRPGGLLPEPIYPAATAAADGLVYLAGTDTLTVVDARAPGQLRRIAAIEVPSLASAVAVRGRQVLVGSTDSLSVVDATDPAAPRVISTLQVTAPVTQVATGDGHAFAVMTGGQLLVVDLTDPAAPAASARLGGLAGDCFDLAAGGGYLYLMMPDVGIQVVDVRDPLAPRLVHTTRGPADTGHLALWRGHLLLGLGQLWWFHLADPARPRRLGEQSLPGYVDDVAVTGDTAVLASQQAGLLTIALAPYVPPRRVFLPVSLARASAGAGTGR